MKHHKTNWMSDIMRVHTLGIAMRRWSHACWLWLHSLDSIPAALLVVLPSVLPCSICSHHMNDFIRTDPISENTHHWVIDLHNNINIHAAKPLVSYDQSEVLHRFVDARSTFVQFLFAVAFTLPESRVEDFRVFCTLAFPTVGLTPPVLESQYPGHSLPLSLFEYVRPYVYRSFESLVVDFVPQSHYGLYQITYVGAIVPGGPDDSLSLLCADSIGGFALQSLVHEERVDSVHASRDAPATARRIVRNIHPVALKARIYHLCPMLSIPMLTEVSSSTIERIHASLQADESTESIVGFLVSDCLCGDDQPDRMVHYICSLGVAMITFGLVILAGVRRPRHRRLLVVLFLLLLSTEIYLSITFPMTGLLFSTSSLVVIMSLVLYRHRSSSPTTM